MPSRFRGDAANNGTNKFRSAVLPDRGEDVMSAPNSATRRYIAARRVIESFGPQAADALLAVVIELTAEGRLRLRGSTARTSTSPWSIPRPWQPRSAATI